MSAKRTTKPEVLMLVTGELFAQVFRSETLAQLGTFAEVVAPAEKDTPLAALLPTAQGVITSWGSSKQITEEFLDQALDLKIIAHAAGSARAAAQLALPRGITVVNGAPAIARSVAEYCLGMTIACLRRVLEHDRNMKAATTKEQRDTGRRGITGRGIFGKRVGLVGFGYTAREYTKLLQPFEPEISAYDPYVDDAVLAEFGVTRAGDLKGLLADSEIVSLHVPGHVRHLIGRAEFKSLKDGAVFINSSGGPVFDPNAFAEEAATGRFWAATEADPFEGVLPEDSPIRRLQNVIVTPHIAGPTLDARWMMGDLVVEELRRFFAGAPTRYAISPKRVEHVA